MIGRAESVLAELQVEFIQWRDVSFDVSCTTGRGRTRNNGRRVDVGGLHGLFPFSGGPNTADGQLVLIQPAHHIEIDHRNGLVEWEDRVVDVEVRAEQALFLTAEGNEDERTFVSEPGRCRSRF